MKYILTILSTLWVAGLGLTIWDHFSNPAAGWLVLGIAVAVSWAYIVNE